MNNSVDNFENYKKAIARIYHDSGEIVGAGFLVSNEYLVTCSHVVASALGLPPETIEAPKQRVKLDFPFIDAEKLEAEIKFWLSYKSWKTISNNEITDIAGLKLSGTITNSTESIRLVSPDSLYDHPFKVIGFPTGHHNGIWANGVFKDSLANDLIQIEGVNAQGYSLKQGFSGAPIWDDDEKGVVGMAVAAERNEERKVSFLLPTQVLFSAWRELSNFQQNISSKQSSERDFNTLTDLEKEALIDQIAYYYDDEQKLRTIFTRNQEIFGLNFYGRVPGNDPYTKTINLTEELIRRKLMNDFVKICRKEYSSFAINLYV